MAAGKNPLLFILLNEGAAPEMSELGPVERESFFRTVPWRVCDPVIGYMPVLAWRVACPYIYSKHVSERDWWVWVFVSATLATWMLLYPLCMALFRSTGCPRLPSAHVL